MTFSIVVAFKNRDKRRVKLFLDSINWQSYQDFELLFINQGSDEGVNEWLVPLLETFPFVKYFYSDTRGQFFNKSNALNIGIKSSAADLVIIADIDIIFPIDFLEATNQRAKPGTFLSHSAFYLPQAFSIQTPEDTSNINSNSEVFERFIGLCVASRDSFLNIGGYDEYYLVWGGEDDDIIFRLEISGLKRTHISAKESKLFHQWHISLAPSLPTPWYLETIQRLYIRGGSKGKEYGKLIATEERTVMLALDDLNRFKPFELYGDAWLQYNYFYIGFSEMKGGEFGVFKFPEKGAPVTYPVGRKQKVVNKLNLYFKKWNFPYKMEKITKPEPKKDMRDRWLEFIIFFVGRNRECFADYFVVDKPDQLALYFQKK